MTVSNGIKKRTPVYSDITCTCGKLFTPLTSKNKRCSWECRFKDIFESAERIDECVIWPKKPGSHGYGQFTIGGINGTSHTTAFRYFKGVIPSGKVVMHSCDNRLCINPDHLALGTLSENIKDMWAKGRQRSASTVVRGDAHPNSRFTEVQKELIRQTYSGVPSRQAALELGCEKSTVLRILKSKGSQNKDAMLADK